MTASTRGVRVLLSLALLGLPAGVTGSRADAPAQPPGAGLTAGDYTILLQHGGRRRSYLVHVPKAAGAGVRPVVLAIHSVDDPRALYNGGLGPPFPGADVRSAHRPATEGLEKWRVRNGCSSTTRTLDTRTGRSGSTKQTATLLEWDGCAAGARVAHWKLTGVGHGWPGSAPGRREEIIGTPTTLVNAAEEIWRFVSRVAKN